MQGFEFGIQASDVFCMQFVGHGNCESSCLNCITWLNTPPTGPHDDSEGAEGDSTAICSALHRGEARCARDASERSMPAQLTVGRLQFKAEAGKHTQSALRATADSSWLVKGGGSSGGVPWVTFPSTQSLAHLWLCVQGPMQPKGEWSACLFVFTDQLCRS